MPILGLFVSIVLSYFIGILGRNRKLGFWGYFFASLVLTPLIGLLLVVATDPVKETDEEKQAKNKKVFKKVPEKDVIDSEASTPK
jgi:uncharacterized membrane protein YiaA